MRNTILNLKRVYQYGKKYKKSLIIQAVCCLFGISFNILMPLLSAKLIVSFTDSIFNQALGMAFIILGLSFINEIKTLIIRKNTQIFRRGTIRNIEMSLGKEILKLNQPVIDVNSTGMFIQRLTVDTDKMAGMFTTGMGKMTGFISNIGSFVAIFFLDWHMFIYYLMAAITLTLLYYIKNEKVGEKDKLYRNQSEKVSGLTGELIRGSRDIKMLFAKDSFMKEFDNNINSQSELNFEMRNADMHYNLIIDSIKDVFEFITLVLLIVLIKRNILTVAVAFALFSYKSTVLTNLMSTVSSLLEECKGFNISSERVFEIIDSQKFEKEKFGHYHLDKIAGNFEFKNVCFSYDNKKKVINNLNLKIEANKTYGIVGKSGEGKTTMFNLLCKLYDNQSGDITIDGVNIKELDEESIRGNITIISQNPYIFNLSIKDNLKLVKSDVTDEEIYNACNLACLTEFIESLPKQYDTVVGEGGVNLSGGQRQRLAIARALVQKTKIILFDEATSALDNETQNNIQKAINNLKDNYTIVIIAHRLSTIINCDEIFFMKDGKIESRGTHEQLLKKCKSYKQLYEYEIKSE